MWEKFYILEFAAKVLGGPPCYPIGSLVELLIPISPLFQIQYSFLIFVKAYPRTTEKRKHFCSALKYVLPVHKNLLESGLYLVVFFILSLFSYWLLALLFSHLSIFRISTVFFYSLPQFCIFSFVYFFPFSWFTSVCMYTVFGPFLNLEHIIVKQ